jgi:hypothetical protein
LCLLTTVALKNEHFVTEKQMTHFFRSDYGVFLFIVYFTHIRLHGGGHLIDHVIENSTNGDLLDATEARVA